MQKWPESVTLIRHGESGYNASKKALETLPEYTEFIPLFDQEFKNLTLYDVHSGKFPSKTLKEMALRLLAHVPPKTSDYDTPLTEEGYQQAVKTGQKLPEKIQLPDAIYVSPYLRTQKTLEGIIEGWPGLKGVRTREDDRIREQEYGLQALYGDWRLLYVFHPIEAINFKGPYESRRPNGESLLDVKSRTRKMVETLIRRHGGRTIMDDPSHKLEPENVLLVTHHLTILATRAIIEGWSREKFVHENENNRPVNCGVTIYRGQPGTGENSRHGREGWLTLDSEEYNMKLY